MPSPYSASRFTNLHLTGNLWLTRRSASRAISSDTPAISNITLPRLTGATQPSGAPLPDPIRTPMVLAVYDLCGKIFNPNFTTTFHVTSHGDTSSFDLAVSDPVASCGLKTVFTECYFFSTFASPRIFPRNSRRCLTRLGTNIGYLPPLVFLRAGRTSPR